MRFDPRPVFDWYKETPEDPPWLIEGLLPDDAVVRLSGPRKKGHKSFLCILMATILSTGKRYGNFKPTRKARVLFLQEEGPRVSTQRRLGMVWRGMGYEPEGDEAELGELLQNFRWNHRSGIKLDNPAHVKELKDYLAAEKIDLVILDAITYMHTGDENSNRDMQKVNNAILDIRSMGVTVLYISHTGKTADREGADIDLGVRGASVMSDAYDAHLAVRLDRHTQNLVLHTRFRDAGEGEFTVRWDFHDGHPPYVKGRITPRTEQAYLQEVVDYLVEEGKMNPGQVYSFTQYRSILNMEQGPAMALRAKLIDAGLIERPKDGKGIRILG